MYKNSTPKTSVKGAYSQKMNDYETNEETA